MPAKIALCMIVKGTIDEADHLERCLLNIRNHVDGIFLNLNTTPDKPVSLKVRKIADRFTDNVIVTEWHNNFTEARNANLDQVTDEYTHILWLDTDDTVEHPEKIRKVAEAAQADAILADYLYDQDETGNPLTVHAVARLFRNNGSLTWKGRVHETLIETRSASKIATKDFWVVHHAEEARRDRSFERNIELLKLQLEDEGDYPDPRTMYYLGCTYIDAGQTASAKELLGTYLSLSGWDQERSRAHTKLGRIYLVEGDTSKAKHHFMQAIGEDPTDPEPQVEMGSLELEIEQFTKARKWLEDVLAMDVSMTTLERNPMSYTFRTYLLLADVYLGLGGSYLDKALEHAKKALKYKRKDKNLKEYVKVIEQVVEDKHLTQNVIEIVKKLKKNKEQDKIKALALAVPKQLEDNPLIVRLREESDFSWPEKSIAIMCGDTVDDEWGPWSLEKGIGGSEEAVIRLSKHLANHGYKVVVFAKPMNNAGMHDGVMWRNFWEANLENTFDIFIGWRSPALFDTPVKARKKYLWMHDVVESSEFTEDRLANLDKVILLSKYHRSLFPNIPDEKVLMSANGIDPSDFEILDTEENMLVIADENGHIVRQPVRRDPHKVFYGSSHVRGLAFLYDIWEDVKSVVPEATLDVYYGRGTFDTVHRGNPERMKWMDDMQQRAKDLDGVTDHGKVSQSEIVRHMFSSGVWAYPCPFPEIYCITAIKAQASGAIPVASNFAALDETIQFGHKQDFRAFDKNDLNAYKDALIWWLQHPEEQEKVRDEMMSWARTNSWENVAIQWVKEFEL